MATHQLDEFECDEIHHALLERKGTLEKRIKDLEEKDGLPEAAEAVRQRLALYNPNGEGKASRPGLIRQFAPQRDIEAEARAARAGEERDADGGQDLFGGGAATGGGHPAGEVAKSDILEKKKRGKKKKGEDAGEAGTVKIEGEEADALNGNARTERAEPTDVEFEIVPEERRLAAGNDPVEDSLAALDRIAGALDTGPDHLDAATFERVGKTVEQHLRIILPAADAEHIRAHIFDELAAADDNALALGYYANRMADQVRDAREKPLGRYDHAGPSDSADGAAGSSAAEMDTSSDTNSQSGEHALHNGHEGSITSDLNFGDPADDHPFTTEKAHGAEGDESEVASDAP